MNPGMFQTILVDFPWPEHGGGVRSAATKYQTVPVKDAVKTIRSSPLWEPDPARCSVWFWATANHLEYAFPILRELGAVPVTGFIWKKIGRPGMGQRCRMMHELLLYARIGSVPVPPPSHRWESVVEAHRVIDEHGKIVHSAKPDIFFKLIEDHDGPETKKAELFARTVRAGWSGWGLEYPKGGV
jgi:N6-adenosine-specific RNA methylase IME4